MDALYPQNRRTARNIALGLTGLSLVMVLGIAGDFARIGAFGTTVGTITVAGSLLWIAGGLWKFRFG